MKRSPGSGSIFKRANGSVFWARFFRADGRRVNRSTRTSDRRTAERVLAKWLADEALERAGVIDESQARLAAHAREPIWGHVESYLANCEDRSLAESHIHNKRRELRALLDAIGCQRLVDLDPERVAAYLRRRRDKGRAAGTTNATRRIAVAFASWCVATGRLRSNPLLRVPKADETTDRRLVRRALTDAEQARLLDAALERGGHLRRLWYLAAFLAGLRRGDLGRLTWADVDAEHGVVRIVGGKAKRVDLVPLHPQLAQAFAEGRARASALPSAKVFPTIPTRETVRGDFAAARIEKFDDQGRVADLHAARTTLATRLARQGVPVQIAKTILRHSDSRVTERHYVALRIEDQVRAIAALGAIGSEAAQAKEATS